MARRRNGFTALRLCAALSVLFTHSFVLVGRGEADPLARVARYLSFSSFGVDLFFAISGYLICGSILREPSPRRYILNRGTSNLPCSDCCHHSHRICSRPDHDDRRGVLASRGHLRLPLGGTSVSLAGPLTWRVHKQPGVDC